jgi:hypothetical protein
VGTVRDVATYLEQLVSMTERSLAGDEVVLAALEADYGGKVNLEQEPLGLGEPGYAEATLVAGQRLVERMGEHSQAAFPTAKQMALVLTSRCIHVWSRSALKGKPKAYLGEVPLDAVEHVGHEGTGARGGVTVKMSSGWEVHLDGARAAEAAAFAAAAQRQVDALRS